MLFRSIIWLDSLEKENFNQDLRWYCYLGLAILGFFVFVVAVFPYNVLGLVPSNGDWNRRHQLLIPLGATMMICFGFEFLLRMIDKKGRASILLLSIIAMLFIRINMLGYFDYQRDWYKQQGIIANFESNTIIENHSTFIIKDEYQSANAFGRSYRFYEYSGYLRSLYHEETRFMLPHESYESSDYEMNAFKPYFDPYFSLGSYISIRPEYTIQIEKGSINLESRLNLLKLIYDEWMDTDKFMIERNRFVLVEFVEIE